MIVIRCAICGSNQNTRELYKENFSLNKLNGKIFSARRTPDHYHYSFVKCLRCGLIFSNPILPENQINKLYRESGFTYGLESDFVKETYFKYLTNFLTEKELKKSMILDIGCGNGFFMNFLIKKGVKNVFGIEPGISSVKKASTNLRKRIFIGPLKIGVTNGKKFDIVCCFHTLDHIVNPNVFLKLTSGLLKPGGKAIFIVHDTDGLSVKLFGEKSAIFDIEHVFLFNKENLGEIFRNNNFKSTKTFDVINKYPLIYWFRMTPIPNFLKNFIIDLLVKTKLGRIPISLKAGNIGIVAEK